MPINAINQADPKINNTGPTQQKPAMPEQASLFSKQVETNKSSNKLQHVADQSGLSNLANDDNVDNWHSLMGQTYGYDQGDPNTEGFQQSESVREMVRNNDWAGLDIDLQRVTQGDLGGDAAFIGGDTASTSDDQILINKNPDGDINTAITEELFHAFERKINPEQEGDTRLVNGEVDFTNNEGAAALDEGELGRTLLAQFNESGAVPNTSEDVLTTGGITGADVTNITLNGENVSAENVLVGPLPGIGEPGDLQPNPDPDPIPISPGIDPFDVDDDPTRFDDYFNLAKTESAENINYEFVAPGGITYLEDGSRDYSTMSGNYDKVIADDDPDALVTRWLTDLTGLQAGSQGVQDYLGYRLQQNEFGERAVVNEQMADGVGTAFLNQFGSGKLNATDDETSSIILNPEVLQYFPSEELLNVEDNKASSFAITQALNLQADNADKHDELAAALAGIDPEAYGSALDDNLAYMSENLNHILAGVHGATTTPEAHVDRGGQYALFAQHSYNLQPDIATPDRNIEVGADRPDDPYLFEWIQGGDKNSAKVFNSAIGETMEGFNRDYDLYYNEEIGQAVVAWKGTDNWKDRTTDVRAATAGQFSDESIFGPKYVEGNPAFTDDVILAGKGFIERAEKYQAEINEALDGLNPESVVFTGHSLGAASAQISGYAYSKHTEAEADAANPQPAVRVEGYNPPKVGNQAFADAYQNAEDGAFFTSESYIREGDPVSTAHAPVNIWANVRNDDGGFAGSADGVTAGNHEPVQLDTSAVFTKEPGAWHSNVHGLQNHSMAWWMLQPETLFDV